MMFELIRQPDQHSSKSERGTDVLSRFALGCSVFRATPVPIPLSELPHSAQLQVPGSMNDTWLIAVRCPSSPQPNT